VAVYPGLHAPSLGDEGANLANVRNKDGEVVCAGTQRKEQGNKDGEEVCAGTQRKGQNNK